VGGLPSAAPTWREVRPGLIVDLSPTATGPGVNAALAVTGIAGPGGGTADKPVGLVWFAWSLEDRLAGSEVMQFQGDRDAVRRQTVVHALSGLQNRLPGE